MKPATSIRTRKLRIDIRLDPEQKSLLEEAAAVSGHSLTSFLLANSLPAAHAVIREHQTTVLSRTDAEKFIALLENPPKPNKALKSAVREYLKNITDSDGF
ncbi:MAG: DUF1778 domain-containing protein [Bacteroidia bacterium]|nr:DUF1778 domain-containing protein [Bacteroidia bacterium]